MASLIIEAFCVIGVVLWQILKSFVQIFFPPPRKDISGEIIFLSGAGSGLGRLMAFKFAKLGATVVCVDINESANDETVREIQSQGLKACGYKCDCSSREDIYRVADLVKSEVGDVTMLINNAGIVSGKKFMDTDDRLIQKTFEVNTMAHFWVSGHEFHRTTQINIACNGTCALDQHMCSLSTQVVPPQNTLDFNCSLASLSLRRRQ